MYAQPYVNFNGFYSESELLQNAEDTRTVFEMGLVGYENYQKEAERTLKAMGNFQNKLIDEMPMIRDDLINQKSVAMQEARRGLDQSLKNQATRMATISGGSSALQLAQMNKEANKMSLDAMNKAQINVQKEDMERKKLYYDVMDDRMDSIAQSQETMAEFVNRWGAQNTSMAQAGMQGQINVIRNLVALRTTASAQEIERDKMQLSWNQSMLNAETSVFRSQLGFQLGRFNSITAAQAAMYDSEVRARTAVYAADTEANSANLNTWLASQVGYAQTAMNNNSAEYRALLSLGLGMHQMDSRVAMTELQNRALLLRSGIYAGQETFKGAINSWDQSLQYQQPTGNNPMAQFLWNAYQTHFGVAPNLRGYEQKGSQ